MNEQEYFEMIQDTSQLVGQQKASSLSKAATSYSQSSKLVNDVEFWKWMGANYPKDLSNTTLIQQTAFTKERWLNTQLQGKGYEWDYMTLQRSNPSKILSKFEAGNCPTQPGIDITESSIIDGSINSTYQNKAYLSSNNPDLHNTPKDAIVVTNKEKMNYVQKQGYNAEEYLDAEEIRNIRDSRYQQAVHGKANTTYNLQNVATTAAKAGIIGAVIGMTVETVNSYKSWKNGTMSDEEYLKEVFRAGGDAGITAGVTTAAMIPVQAAVTAAGASTLIGIPITIIFSEAINKFVAPCFGRGEYRKILNEAQYYQCLENVYDDFILMAECAASQYTMYIQQMQLQTSQYNQMQQISKKIDNNLKDLYDSI